MAAETFARAYARLRVHEGGNVDDPRDPGGRTSRGVTQRVYNGYRLSKGLPRRDVWLADEAEIEAIYRAQYWDRSRCDLLPEGIDYVVFDGAVNSGVSQSNKWLQRALGEARIDGIIGHVTLGDLAACEPAAVIDAICARRLAFMRALRTWPRYRGGWTARVDQVQAVGKAWAAQGEAVPVAFYAAGMHAKASIADARPIPSPAMGDGATGGGAVAMALSGAQDKLQPYVDGVPYIRDIVAGLVVAGGAVTLGGLAYGAYVRRRRASLHDALDLGEVHLAPDVPAIPADPDPPVPSAPVATLVVATEPDAGRAAA